MKTIPLNNKISEILGAKIATEAEIYDKSGVGFCFETINAMNVAALSYLEKCPAHINEILPVFRLISVLCDAGADLNTIKQEEESKAA